MSEQKCPCGSASYAECCQRLHLGVVHAQHAAQLMRSRYSAFAMQQIDYLIATTAVGQQSALDRAAIAAWSQANQWTGLEIVSCNTMRSKQHAQVEFKAHYHDGQQAQIHHEVSHFVQHAGRWYFLDPTTAQQVGMKQPCICGASKKFKHCCAQYIT